MDPEFQRAQSDNLPFVSGEMIVNFFENNRSYASCGISGTKAERSARDEYGDNAVGYVQVKRNGSLCTVKARVTPEHRVKNKAYVVTLLCDEQKSQVLSVECESCAAHLGGCKHAIAFIFWVHRRSSEPATTEVVSYWRKSKLSGVGITHKFIFAIMGLWVHKFIFATDIGNKTVKPLPPKDPSVLKDFVEEMRTLNITNTQLNSYYNPNPLKINLSLHVLKCDFSQASGTSAEDFLQFVSAKMDAANCNEAATASCSQSENPLWHELRYGRITASKLYEAAHCSTYDGSLVHAILGTKFKPTEAMKRGSRMESKVIKMLGRKLKVKIQPCGLLLNPKFPAFGASPDGVTENFIVEVKCPTSQKTFETYVKDNKPAAKHHAQMQLQMLLANKTEGLFCVAAPDFEKSSSVREVWIKFDEDFCKRLIDMATHFWCAAIFPKL